MLGAGKLKIQQVLGVECFLFVVRDYISRQYFD